MYPTYIQGRRQEFNCAWASGHFMGTPPPKGGLMKSCMYMIFKSGGCFSLLNSLGVYALDIDVYNKLPLY